MRYGLVDRLGLPLGVTGNGTGGMTYSQVIRATPNLVSYWPATDAASPMVDVIAGNNGIGNAGAVFGVRAGPIPATTGVDLDGVTGLVRATQIAFPAALTLEGWAFADTWIESALMGQWDGTGSFIQIAAGPDLAAFWTTLVQTDVARPSLGAWHYYAGTWDGAVNNLYIDGLLVAGPDAAVGIASPALPFDFGAYNNDSSPNFDGVIAQLALYSRALSAVEVLAHFNAA